MRVVKIDIADEDVEPGEDSIAPDEVGRDAYTIDLGMVELTINYAQMQSLYNQLRPWFVEEPVENPNPRPSR